MMGKILNIIGGAILIFVALGLLTLNPEIAGFKFWESFVTVVFGSIPPIIGLIGLIVLFVGLEELRSESKAAPAPQEPAPEKLEKAPIYEIQAKRKKR
ncbi:MAG: hypothetical protein QW112_00480 [Candidatus Micrarchaeia archaeon]